MKINEIVKIIKENKDISEFTITQTKKNSRELFYVLTNLEINRAVNTQGTSVEVFVNHGDFKGSSIIVVNVADDEKSLKKKLKEAVLKARQVNNPYYPLADKQEEVNVKSTIKGNLNNIALKVADAIFKADVYKDGWINSTEIFVTKSLKTFVSSNGFKHTFENFKIEVEVIPTWSNGKEEFELYKFFTLGNLNYDKATEEVNEILNLAKDRSVAKTLKDIKLNKKLKVLIKNDMRDRLVENFAGDLSYRANYFKMNHYKKEDVISETPFDLTLRGVKEGCADSSKFDRDGFVLKDKKVIKDGKVTSNWGDIRYAYYLKEKPTGNYPIAEISAKGIDVKDEKHLIIETFSSPQLEASNGYFGGEIRLARYFDGKKYIPVGGFSISGNIYEDAKKMKFSKEKVLDDGYAGPKYFIFEGLNIF